MSKGERGEPRGSAALRVAVALLGTLLAVLLSAALLARRLPLAADTRYAVAFVFLVPAWVTAMCTAFLARSGIRALCVCAGVWAVLSALLLYG